MTTEAFSESTLGSRIEQSRAYLNLTASQLATRIGVKKKTVENWESDRSAPRGDKLVRLSGVLQVPLMWLMTGEDMDDAQDPPSPQETASIADKLEKAVAMQQHLATLLINISADVTRLQRDLDDETELAA